MGLGSLSADLVRSLVAGSPARMNAASAERPLGRFGDYLAEARSPRHPPRAEKPEPPAQLDQTAEEEPPEGADRSAAMSPDNDQPTVMASRSALESEAAAAAVLGAPSLIQPGQPEGQPDSSSAESPRVPVADDSAKTATWRAAGEARIAGGCTPEQMAPTESASAALAAEDALLAAVSTSGSERALRGDAAAASEAEAGGSTRSTEVSPSQIEAADGRSRVEPAAAGSRETSPAEEQTTARRIEESASPQGESEDGDEENRKPTTAPDHRSTGPRRGSDVETIHGLKMKDSIARRREGSANGSNDDSPDAPRPGSGRTGAPQIGRPEQPPLGQGRGLSMVAVGSEAGATATASDSPTATGTGGSATSFLDAAGVSDSAAREGAVLVFGKHSAADAAGVRMTELPSGAVTPGSASLNAVGRALGDMLSAELTGSGGPASSARVLDASATSPGRFQMAVQLDPPELGQVRLQIQMQQQTISLRVDVESRTVAKLIQSRMSELHDALAAQGIRVDRTDVVVRGPSNGDAGLNQQDGGQGGDPGRTTNEPAGGWTAGGHLGGPPERGAGEGGWDGGAADEPWTTAADERPEEIGSAAYTQWSNMSLDVVV